MRIIHTDQAPAAIGPYSQAMEVNGVLFTSGQIAINHETGSIEATDIAGQADQACRNIEAILKEAGVGFGQVVKTTCYLTDMSFFNAFNEVYARYFVSKPARSCVAVAALPKNAMCEIEAIAEMKAGE